MNDLLELTVLAHGGLDRWNCVKSIEATLTVSGGLFEIKGFPDRLRDVSVTVDADRPHRVSRGLEARLYRGSWHFRSLSGIDGSILQLTPVPNYAARRYNRFSPVLS
jgi:hypothetical protein